jgi:hypothetical protein
MFNPEARLIIEMDFEGMDFDKLADRFEKEVDDGLQTLADKIEKVWRDKAREKLDTSLQKYLDGIHVDVMGKEIQASLKGFLPVSLETGLGSYDMKPGLLGNLVSKVIPIGKGAGKTIDFKRITHSTPGWRHPGFEPRKIFEEVEGEIRDTVLGEVFGPLISRVSV